MANIASALSIQRSMNSSLVEMNSTAEQSVEIFQNFEAAAGRSLRMMPIQININCEEINSYCREINNTTESYGTLNQEIDQSINLQNSMVNAMDEAEEKSKSMTEKIKAGFEKVKAVADTCREAFQKVQDVAQKAYVQKQSEANATAAIKGAGGNEAQVNAMKSIVSEQQKNGVVADEVQMSGIDMMGNYVNNADAIMSLIPAMNNLAVAQDGVKVSSETMQGVSGAIGQAMNGQMDALSKMGVTLTDEQNKMLQYGDASQKATAISQAVTSSVGNMNSAMANTPNGKVAQMGNIFNNIKESVGGALYKSFMGLVSAINGNLPSIQQILVGFSPIIGFIIQMITLAIEIIGTIAGFISENWSIISPILWGIIAAIVVYNSVMAIGWLMTLKDAAMKVWNTICTWAEYAAIMALIIAQDGLNTALAACPITWIIIAIIILIALFYGIIALINSITGSSLSATGIICGVIAAAGAFIWNAIIGVINGIIQVMFSVIDPILDIIEFVLNAANGGFDSFGGAVANLIGKIISWVLNLGKIITKIIDAVFGINWTASLDSLQAKVSNWGKNDKAITLEKKAPVIGQRIEYKDAWNGGSNFGKGIDNKLSSMFSMDKLNSMKTPKLPQVDGLEGLKDNVANTANNTSEIADSVNTSEEDLKYLRDIAEQEAINRFTTAEIKVDMTNNNTVNNDMDLDGMVNYLQDKLYESMVSCAEGVHACV